MKIGIMNLKGIRMFALICLLAILSCENVSIRDIVGSGGSSGTRFNIETLDNPVLPEDAADPSLLDDRERTGYYYLYTTENGECDIPVYRSKNLVDWEFVGDAFPDGFQRKWGESWARPWAPDINYINGKYVLYYSMGCWNEPMLSESGVAVSDSPEGPFADIDGNPLLNRENCRVFNPIDVSFFDDGEKKYIFWGSYKLSDDPSVDYGIYAIEVTDDGLAIKEGASKVKVAGNQIEGTMVTKKDGWYYLFASTGQTLAGTSSDYRVVVGRSDNILGPYAGPDGTPMLDNDGYNNYILSGDGTAFFGTGHNSGIVTDDAGQSWMVYHTLWTGNNLSVRVVCLDRIIWTDGWPSLVTGHPVTDGTGPMFKINL